MECLFCQIARGQLPCSTVYENDQVLAFQDLHPQAPTHILIIPKKHIATINDLEFEDAGVISELVLTAKQLAAKFHHQEHGYRLIMNCNEDGGQTVFHIHLHLLAGRRLNWPPG